jgi:hypothetical protein
LTEKREKELNALGEEGWEMSGVAQHPPVTYYYFKRPIENELEPPQGFPQKFIDPFKQAFGRLRKYIMAYKLELAERIHL